MRFFGAITFAMVVFFLSPFRTLFASECNLPLHQKKVSLKQIYLQLRFRDPKCKFPAKLFLAYSERALLAGRLHEALWSAKTGMKRASSSIKRKLTLAAAKAYNELNRYEEAIALLKPLAFSTQKDNLAKQAHICLIRAYYLRAKQKQDSNVKYLVSKFRRYYGTSL
ncbi:MAG: hypothetical protein D6767_09115 [Candidatus Hydrogenedentota bacterium]|nr:MAG: hypothetical protein D6767_09115 [Candidatus Hydrogenedentota bacterium]